MPKTQPVARRLTMLVVLALTCMGCVPAIARAGDTYQVTLTSSWGRPDWALTDPAAAYFPQDMIMGTAYGAYPAGSARAWRIRPASPTLRIEGAFLEGSFTTKESAYHAYVRAGIPGGAVLQAWDMQSRGPGVLQARISQPVDWVDFGLTTTLASNQSVLDNGLVHLNFAVVSVRDVADPTIGLVEAPDGGRWYGTACVPIHASVADSGSGLTWVDIADVTSGADLAGWTPPHQPNTMEVGAPGIDAATCAAAGTVDGTNVFRITAVDVSGRATTSEVVAHVDHTAPTLSPNVADGTTYDVPRPALSFDTTDQHAGVAAVAATVDGGAVAVTRSSQRVTITLTHGLAPGHHTLAMQSVDAAGNAANAARTFTVRDVTAPVLTLAPGADSGLDTTTVVARASDETEGSGIDPDSWEVSVDATPVSVLGSTSGVQATLGPLAVGAHQVTVRVRDRSGNVAAVTRGYVVLDQLRPAAIAAGGGRASISSLHVTGGHSGIVLLHALPKSVAYGSTVRLDVQVVEAGEALAGRRVLVDVGGVARDVAITDVQGIATVAVAARRSGEVRVQVPGTSLGRVIGTMAIAPVVRLRTTMRHPKVGTSVRLTGRVAPVGSTRIVFLEARIGRTWFPLRRSVRVARNGRFTTTVRSTSRGAIGVRVRSSSRHGWAAATSNQVVLRVHR